MNAYVIERTPPQRDAREFYCGIVEGSPVFAMHSVSFFYNPDEADYAVEKLIAKYGCQVKRVTVTIE